MKLSVPRAAALVVALTLVVFARAASFSFIHLDDALHLDSNPALHPVSLPAIWGHPYAGMYIPVTFTAWAAIAAATGETDEYRADVSAAATRPVTHFRFHPWAFHAANVALHAVNAALVFFLLHSLVGSVPGAVAGALLFAWHPAQVEPVAWVSGLRDVLSATFSLWALILYVGYARRAKETAPALRDPRYAGAAACAVLAVLSKPTAIAVPLMAALLAWRALGRGPRAVLGECALMLLLALPPAVIVAVTHPTDNGIYAVPPLWQRPFIALDAIGFYLAELASPGRLGIDYGRTPASLFASGWIYATPLIALALGGAYVTLRRRRAPIEALPVEWFLVALLPVSGLLSFYQGNSTVSDRYLYVALLGPALAAALAIAKGRLQPLVATILILFAARAWVQLGTWRDTESVAQNALELNPKSWLAHNMLAFSALSSGRRNDAVAQLEECARLRPQYETFDNIATIRMDQKRYPDSLAALEKAIALRPGNPADLYNVGLSKMYLGDHAGAIDAFRSALTLQPDFALAAKGIRHLEGEATRAPAASTVIPP